jgi:hypothetical protein
MTQLTWERSPPRPPEGGRNGRPPIARTGAGAAGRCGKCGDVLPPAGRSLLHRLGCLGTWFRSDEGPPLTPKEEEERWRLLFRCGF